MELARHPNELELVDLELRVVRSRVDLRDIDFMFRRAAVRNRDWSRARAVVETLARYERLDLY